jgi:Holliday junction DNA helicase RuvA
MYEFIKGNFEEITPSYIIINCNNIGFRLEISLSSYSFFKDKSEGKVFTHFVVREDCQILYGFASTRERELFRQLISVSGIGPNTARMILSSLNSDELIKAISTEDTKTINNIKGIGAKTAQRLIIDLKDKLKKMDYDESSSLNDIPSSNKNRTEALLALQTLGFNKVIVEKTLDKILKTNNNITVEGLIKEALKRL